MELLRDSTRSGITARGRPKVLVVDDSDIVLEWTTAVLGEAGFEVVTRSSAMGTTLTILREAPDIVLIDVQMPGLEGDDIVQSVRQSSVQTASKVLLFSGMAAEELEVRARKCGADGFVRKTNDEAEFVRRVRGWLDTTTEAPRAEEHLRTVLAAGSGGMRRFLRLALSEFAQLSIVEAHDGAEAFRLVASGDCGLFIADSGLPNRAALDIVNEWREKTPEGAPLAPAILIGGRNDERAVGRGNELGVTHTLPKPVHMGFMRAAVRDALYAASEYVSPEVQLAPRLRSPVLARLENEPDTEIVVWDLNPFGAFLRTDAVYPVDTRAKLVLHLPHRSAPVAFQTRVVHYRLEPVLGLPRGIGVSFEPQDAEDAKLLREVFTSPGD